MTLIYEFILPVAVIVSAAATTATAGFAYQLWRATELHDRALFGDEELDRPGLLRMARQHRAVIERELDAGENFDDW